MPRCLPSICLPFIGRLFRSRSAHSRGPHIHIVDDDSLLNIFCLCRPVLLDKDKEDGLHILEGGKWDRERWWYKLAQVCRRWRYLILGSPSHLGLSLLCTYGTPVAEMLAHSPHLPLIIDRLDEDHNITAEDEEGIVLALQHRDRVRRIRLEMPASSLQRLITAIDDEFPMLEYLYIASIHPDDTGLILPNTFQAPQLCHLVIVNPTLTIGSPLPMTAVGLVTLALQGIPSSAYFRPNDLLQRLSFMPQLETLVITFSSPVPHDVAGQLLDTSIMTHVTLPNLRWFVFKGLSAYLEALLAQITTPLLQKLEISFFNQLTLSVPNLVRFLSTSENFRFGIAGLYFYGMGILMLAEPKGTRKQDLIINVRCIHLDWQVAFAAQISNALSPVFSAVERLNLAIHQVSSLSSEGHHDVDRTLWRTILTSFSNVKILCIGNRLVGHLSRSLQFDDGELPLELLPELEELSYSASGDTGDAFTSFIDARRIAGRPVNVIRS